MHSHLPDQVCAAHNANQPALVQHGRPLNALVHQEVAHLFQVSVWSHTDDPTAHNLTDRPPLFANDIVLGHHTHHDIVSIDDGQSTNTVLC